MPSTDITKLTLSNGLLVLLKEITTAPIISHWVWYRVGSRDEPTGLHRHLPLDRAHAVQGHAAVPGQGAGQSHRPRWRVLECLHLPRLDHLLRDHARRQDRPLPCVSKPTACRTACSIARRGGLRAHGDHLRTRRAVRTSRLFRLGEAVQNAAFRVHPYHHEIIGDMADLQTHPAAMTCTAITAPTTCPTTPCWRWRGILRRRPC